MSGLAGHWLHGQIQPAVDAINVVVEKWTAEGWVYNNKRTQAADAITALVNNPAVLRALADLAERTE